MPIPARLEYKSSLRKHSATLRSIVEIIVPDYPRLDSAQRAAVVDDVTRYVSTQIDSMPGFLRLPYELALLSFEALPVLRHGRLFHRLSPAARASVLARWSDASLLARRNFVKLIRSTALLAYFDHPLVARQLEEGATVAPQKAANE